MNKDKRHLGCIGNLNLLGEGESKIITSKPLFQTKEARNMATLLNGFVIKAHMVLKDLPQGHGKK